MEPAAQWQQDAVPEYAPVISAGQLGALWGLEGEAAH